jgi:hypothetical protein
MYINKMEIILLLISGLISFGIMYWLSGILDKKIKKEKKIKISKQFPIADNIIRFGFKSSMAGGMLLLWVFSTVIICSALVGLMDLLS